ncbi:MAG TPA: 50S ribosomal protein L25 [Chloroflexota bacterium]|nr:50S ribosomal protein L25 [Chloroflexota bacterium]
MAQPTVEVRPRSVLGKKVKTLRRKGILPANVYGHDRPSQALELDAHTFNLLQRHLPSNAIVDLVIDGARPRPAMIHRTQRDVRTGLPIHVEFFQINPRERLTASVPLVLVGESEAATRGDAVLLQEMHTLDVSSLLSDLPHAIEVHLDRLREPGDAILVQDLEFDRSRVETRANPEDRVVALTTPQIYEEPAAPAAEEAALAAEEGAAAATTEGNAE